MKLEFSRQIFEKIEISSFIKTGRVGIELFQADRRTDMIKLIITFRNFANAPKMAVSISRSEFLTSICVKITVY